MSVSVCLSVCVFVCPRSYIRNYTSDLHQFFAHVTCGRGSVLWRRSDTLSTSGFMDDVIFAHKPRLVDVAAQQKRSAHVTLGLAIKLRNNTSCQRTHGTTFRTLKVTSQRGRRSMTALLIYWFYFGIIGVTVCCTTKPLLFLFCQILKSHKRFSLQIMYCTDVVLNDGIDFSIRTII